MDNDFWPNHNTHLFSGKLEKNSILNACLNFLEDMSHGYTEGYRKAGEILIKYIIESNDAGAELDYLIYPIAFLFRQHLELRLKEIICLSHILLHNQEKISDGHKLNKLWKEARDLLKNIYSKESEQKDFDMAEKLIMEFDEIDKSSQEFRYPLSKSKNKHLQSRTHINLINFSVKINGLNNFFSNLDINLRVKIEHEEEMRQYYAGEQ